MSRVLVYSCLHAPFVRKGYIDFLKKVSKEYKCDTFVSLGDEVDFHTLSVHLKSPEAKGTVDELDKAIEILRELYTAFPETYCCLSNHTSRPFRKGAEVGLGERFLKTYNTFLDAPKGWKWGLSWEIDGVKYVHGDRYGNRMGGSGAGTPHKTAALIETMPTVMGHFHTVAGIEWLCNDRMRWFGMTVGCGADQKSYAAMYTEGVPKKWVLGCGVVLDGKVPIWIPMELGTKIKVLR